MTRVKWTTDTEIIYRWPLRVTVHYCCEAPGATTLTRITAATPWWGKPYRWLLEAAGVRFVQVRRIQPPTYELKPRPAVQITKLAEYFPI